MHSVVDVQGVNSLITRVFANAAAAICGMVRNNIGQIKDGKGEKTIALSMLGTTTPGALRAKNLLEAKGYEVVAFHQNGTGGIAMEDLIREGFSTECSTLTPHEVADRLVGGLHGSIQDYRLTAAAAGIPQVIAPGRHRLQRPGSGGQLKSGTEEATLYCPNPTLTLVRLTLTRWRPLPGCWQQSSTKPKGRSKSCFALKGSLPQPGGGSNGDPVGNQVSSRPLRKDCLRSTWRR